MSIASSFILLTGQPGVGKTTLIKQLVDDFKRSRSRVQLAGFYTEELRDSSHIRVGFEAVSVNSSEQQRCILANLKSTSATTTTDSMPGAKRRVGKYYVHVNDFEEFLAKTWSLDCDVLVVDEIGRMELLSDRFAMGVTQLLLSQQHSGVVVVIATIPLRGGGPVVDELRQRFPGNLYHITKSNRNSIYSDIAQHLQELLVSAPAEDDDE